MAVPTEIHTLTERFHESREAFVSGEYNETQLRREFLDPFFTALGWDVDNRQGFAEAYKDVIHEDAIKIGTATKAPDYSFRIGGVRKFFVEAKKPAVNLKEDVNPAYQLRRYAWSAKLPLSILTDFEELAVYDCRIKPFPADKPSTGRTMYFSYPQYISKWEEIHGIFSKEAVLKGSFDKYAETNKIKRGTAGVDDAFLGEIEKWRTMLASNIALRNPDLTQRELNFAVQRTIDRLIFLRICEDRGIELYGALMALQNGEHVYKRLVEMFHRADEKYNSGLFHFRPEKERNEPPDEMTLGLEIDDKPLKDIVKSLYYPNSPYEFSVLPADILGQVYEQFLGKVIRLTAGHRAVVEDKPEVKKAGGVYYTPTYIVEYIVKNTVGRLLGSDLSPSLSGGEGVLSADKDVPDGFVSPALSRGEGVLSADKDVPRYMTTDAGTWKYLKPLARENRHQPTEAEERLWQRLRNRQLGVKFRRQHAIDQFVVDFVCIEKNLVVEVDGEMHVDQREYDAERTRMLNTRGFEVIRFWNHEVVGNIEDVLARIRRALDLTQPHPSPFRRGDGGEVQITPRHVSKLRILDPACGSGSFLIGAYQYLLDWHRDWYVNDGVEKWAKGKNPTLYLASTPPALQSSKKEKGGDGGGSWRLTTTERKRILLNNIYGVDIDPQAVEVTKLSLLLKVLEGENEQTISRQLRMFHERALPDLGSNIKCGNSLIGPDFYDGQQLSFMDDDERLRINAFDWRTEFKEIMDAGGPARRNDSGGGFDAVIGNPPYGAFFGPDEKEYIRRSYKSYQYKFDSYTYFMEKGILLLRQDGFLGYITPELWLRLENAEALRRTILETTQLDRLRIYGEGVFENAVVNTVVLIAEKGKPTRNIKVESATEDWELELDSWRRSPLLALDYRVKGTHKALLGKVRSVENKTLSEFGDSIQGITAYDRYTGQTAEVIKNRAYHSSKKENKTYGKWLSGKDVSRYKLNWSGEWLSYGPWLAAPREPRFFEGPRLLFREVPGPGKRIQSTFAKETFYHGHSITPFKPNASMSVHVLYLLGLANSTFISWYATVMLSNFGKDVFPKLNPQDIKQLPIRTINFSDPADKSRHDRMVGLVDQMLELNKKLPEANTDHEQQVIQRQIDATDKQIDELVYELYGLTEEERKIVEGNTS